CSRSLGLLSGSRSKQALRTSATDFDKASDWAPKFAEAQGSLGGNLRRSPGSEPRNARHSGYYFRSSAILPFAVSRWLLEVPCASDLGCGFSRLSFCSAASFDSFFGGKYRHSDCRPPPIC